MRKIMDLNFENHYVLKFSEADDRPFRLYLDEYVREYINNDWTVKHHVRLLAKYESLSDALSAIANVERSKGR